MTIAIRRRLGQRLVLGVCVLAASVGLGIGAASAQQVAVQVDQPDYRAPESRPQRSANRSNAVAAVAPTAGSPSAAKPARRSQAVSSGKGPYYVDFRARTAATYGHAFVWYGRTGEKQVEVAGLHPAGDEGPYMLGHLTFVPSETGASYGDLDVQYLTASYRVYLNEEDARKVFAYIKHLQATHPLWNAETINCTFFIGEIASFMGLKVPFHLQKPEAYVNQLREMNGGRQRAQLDQ
jgi:hypothetical protein